MPRVSKRVQAEAEAQAQLDATYKAFLKESEPRRKKEAGKVLIRAIFGKNSIAEASVL